jgi:diguanylate cyclase (GGDEF)-like protein/PAS domain S-box-containing protein
MHRGEFRGHYDATMARSAARRGSPAIDTAAGLPDDQGKVASRRDDLAAGDTEGLYRQVVAAIPGLTVLVVDEAMDVVLAGGGGLRGYGFAPEDIEGRALVDVVGARRLEAAIDHYRAGFAGEASVEEHVERDGHRYWVRYLPLADEESIRRYVVAVTLDVTERDAAQLGLARSEHAYAAAFDRSLVANALVDQSGVITRANDAFGALLGVEASELLGMTWQALTHPEDLAESAEAAEQLLTGQRASVILDKRFLHADGHAVDVLVGTTLVRDEAGQPLHFHSQIVDVSTLRSTQAELRAQALTDPLTGLVNRRGIEEALRAHCGALASRARLDAPPLDGAALGAVVLLDLDRFKILNDTFGHAFGDAALRAVARRWRGRLRHDDVLGRFGGDEFIVLLPRADARAAETVAEALVVPVAVADDDVPAAVTATDVTACAGVAVFGPGEDCDTVVRRADAALLAAKAAGPGRARISP